MELIQNQIIPRKKMKNNNIFDKKTPVFKSPDLNNLQVVVIDHRTKIYIAPDADPDEARSRYHARRKQSK